MKLKFLGTSNANPNPGFGQSGLLLEINNRYYLCDCGDCIPTKIWLDQSIRMNDIDAAFITHYHPDHVGGLFSFLLLMDQRIKESKERQPGKDGVLDIFIPEIGGPEGKSGEAVAKCFAELADMFHLADKSTVYKKRFVPYSGTREIYSAPGIEVSCFPTLHNQEAHGFIISAAHKKIIYTGDIQQPSVLTPFIRNADLVVMESAHFPITAIPPAFRGQGVKTLVLVHMLDARMKDYITVLDELKPLAGECNILIGKDGMEFPL